MCADVPAVEDPVGGGSRQHRIVGEEECVFGRSVKGKALGFDVAELVDAAYDVADKAADHGVEVWKGVSVRGVFPVKIWELAVGAKSIVFVMLNRSRLG